MLHLDSQPKRILVVRSLPGLGDLLCSVPALRALRTVFPASQISFLGLPELRWFGDRFSHLMDDWVEFAGYPGIPEGWQGVEAIPPFLAAQQARNYDLAIQLHGNGSYINPFLMLLGAKLNAGFFVPGQFCPDPRHFLPYPAGEPEIWRMLRLLEFLQIPLQGDQLEFPLQSSDHAAYHRQVQHHGLQPQSYVCIHPGASGDDRRWSTEGFAAVADALAQQGYTIVLTGNAAERSLTEQVAQRMVSHPINVAGQTQLGAMAILLQQAALLVCNDTGISHLAAAMKTPSVVVFSNSETQRWAPLNRDRHRVVDVRQAQTATSKMVLAEAEHLLAKQPQWEVACAG
ncbi:MULTISPECIES: glycosyltransferase family 9 protein [unclassified Leptolyngbya]|uniref:glycosyltransferase family 9 protein n=1 Tax=unclassified Leptolyngbya TaxID=2650499 RepID=UPI001681E3A4|nr:MULTISPECIES: glycosyltransferase family 9 protein [unclassified Leptolyngbya]MBD1909211.1 glycosyltransferase family 9 protein [Leptolyngbya sp. FACHB-8]MBD2153986.1 glycosyltransferase family 9 protein [Leptolyngbya sp. FACHB-16]